MKLLSLAICSLGIWVLLNSFVGAIWDDIVFGALAAILAFIAMFTVQEQLCQPVITGRIKSGGTHRNYERTAALD